MLACEHGYEGIVRTLISSGAAMDYTDEKGCSAVHAAVKAKQR